MSMAMTDGDIELVSKTIDEMRTIYGIPGLREGYQASRDGKIMSPSGHELKPDLRKSKKGARPYIFTVINGRNSVTALDVLVLSAYYGYEANHEPIHLDGDLTNCHLENLQWSPEPVAKIKGRRRTTSAHKTVDYVMPKKVPDVEVYRTYVSEEVMATISDDGSGSVSVGGTTLSLTARQLLSLTRVAARIAEVNALMGIG